MLFGNLFGRIITPFFGAPVLHVLVDLRRKNAGAGSGEAT